MSTSVAYFLIPTGPNSTELWSTDGAASSTLRIGPTSGNFPADPAMLTSTGSNLFFVDEATGNLWVTAGKIFGTSVLTTGIQADHLTAVGQTLFFVNDATGALWTSDGTSGGTQAVAEASGLSVEDLTAVGSTLFFVDASTNDLWTLSGGIAQDVGNFGTPSDLTAVGNELYFVDSSGDLWKSNGTAGGTTDVTPAAGGFTLPTNLVGVGSTLYFIDSATGNLWTSDGTAGGTVELTPGVQASDPTAVGNELFFVDAFGGLWVSNGTVGGTQELGSDFAADHLTAVGSELYFTDDFTGTLWKSDGTAGGTVRVTQQNTAPFDPTNLADVNGALYFQAFDPTNGPQLWTSDGTAAGTHVVDAMDNGSGPETNPGEFLPFAGVNGETFVLEAVDPIGFSDQLYATNGIPGTALTAVDPGQNFLFNEFSTASVGGQLYFTPADSTFEVNDLWKTDGTQAGTVQITPASGSFLNPTALTALDGEIYFYDTTDNELWKSDGTSAGTVEVGGAFGSIGGSLAVFGNSLAFVGGVNIWLIDGTSGTQTEITGSFGVPFDLTPVGGTLFFTDGSSLWKTDGTEADTTVVASGFGGVQNLTAVGSDVYFTDFATGSLWESDGTAPGTVQITASSGSFSDPSFLTADGGTLYFLATDGNSAPDTLWETNGATTTEVYSSSVDTADGLPTVANGTLYFIAGGQLWMTTPGSTTATEVTSTEGAFSQVSALRTEGNTAYFQAYDATDGYQLWTTDGTASGTVRLTQNTEPVGAAPSDITAGPGAGALNGLHTAALAGGGFAVAFTAQSDTPGDSTNNIYAEVFNANGQQIGGMIEVNPPNAFDDSTSFITALPNGDFAVTWQTGATGDEIDTRVFEASGNPVSSAQIVTAGGHSAEAVQTIALSNGGYAVLYQENDAGDENVYVGLFNADGTPASAPVEVDIPVPGVSNSLSDTLKSFDDTEHNQIVATQNGFAVMWSSTRDDGSGSVHENVFVRAFNNDGTPVTGEINANGPDGASADSPEEITALGGDNFAVEWGSTDSAGNSTVFTRAFDSANYTASSPVQADLAGPPATFDLPNHLITLADGDYVALWDQFDNADLNSNTFVQVYNPQGQVVSASPTGIQVDTDTDISNISDQAIALAGGGFAVMWEQINLFANTEDVFVRTFDASGNATSAPVLVDVPDGGIQTGQEMIALQDGSFDVLWTQDEDTANGSFQNLLFEHIAADGTVLSAPTIIASTPTNSANSTDVSAIFELRGSLGTGQNLLTGEIDGDTVDGAPSSPSLALQFTTPPPQISNPDTVMAAAGTGPIALDIAAPTDSDDSTPTITIDTVPSYGIVQYFNGSTFVTATANTTLTPAELASLEYTPPASGEFGGQTISYTATDGTASNTGTIAVTVLAEDTQRANLYFSAFGGTGNSGNPDLYTLDQNGNPLAIPLNVANGSSAGEDGGFFQFAGNLYFNANGTATSDTEALYELAPNGTVTAVSAGANSFDGFFDAINGESSNFTEFDGSLYFGAEVNTGGQVVKLNADGTSQVITLDLNNQSMAGQNGGFVEFNGDLYFSAVTTTTNGFNPDLIQLDPNGNITEISTRSPADAAYGSSAGEDGGFYVFNNALYFNAYSDTLGDTLFELTAGSTTPVPVDPSGGVLSHETGVSSAFHEFDGSLYFNELSNAVGNDTLFKLDSSGTLTALEYQNQPLVNAGEFNGFVDFAGSTYFAADLSGVTTLFKLDATGTITAIYNAGGTGAFDDNLVSGFEVFNGDLYFDANDSTGGDSLFQLTANGTLTTINLGDGPGATTLAGVDGGFQVVGNNLYFSAYTPNGYELVRLGADGTVHEFDIAPGAGNNSFGTGGGFPSNALGTFPDNVINGTAGNDILVGSTPDETIVGGPGNNVLEGRGGNDILIGGAGTNDFVFSAAGTANVDTVTNYSLAQGDILDISALIDANFTAGSQVVDFVRLIASGNDLTLQVDPNGRGDSPHVWEDVAILQNANVDPVNQVTAFFAGADHTITQTTDLTAPTVQNVVFNAPSSDVDTGGLITIALDISEAVTVDTANGSPTLGLNDGGTATFDDGKSTSTDLVFDYTVLAGQSTTSLTTSALGVSLNGASIEDAAANDVNFAGAQNAAPLSTIEVNIAPCYCPGTLIKTKRGQKPVEKLKIGDKIMTASGVARPIKWIGQRSYSGRFVMGRGDILPACIKAGAIDDNVPKRDLWISPHHAMYLDGVLIEAKDLVNGVSIVQAERVEKVEYFHIELDTHDVIIAEGALSESFFDDDIRGLFQNAHEYRALYPGAVTGPKQYCAPRCEDGYEVEAVRRRIGFRAGLVSSDKATRLGDLRGHIDRITAECIAGWAQNTDHSEAPVCLDIYAGGRLIGQVLANQYREDLERAGLGSGNHSFEFFPPAGLVFAPNSVEVRRSLDGEALALTVDTWRTLQQRSFPARGLAL